MHAYAALALALTAAGQAREGAEASAEDVEDHGIELEVTTRLHGETARGDAAPPATRVGDKVVTEDGSEIAFIDLDPREASSLPPAWVVASTVGGAMLVLGVLASLLMLRASSSDGPTEDR